MLGIPVLNAYDVSQTPSGSNSGSAVAAATGLAAVTIGNISKPFEVAGGSRTR
jgi:Asp-tRNA(Asn)/Glu-tRNA(Gln) amidotransferase A subunit family amidase